MDTVVSLKVVWNALIEKRLGPRLKKKIFNFVGGIDSRSDEIGREVAH
jgi:hypothetical protein